MVGGGTEFKRSDKSRFGGRFGHYKDGRNVGNEVFKKIISWDTAPTEEYFQELFRVSQRQIIWGGNYFNLPPSRNFIVWDKKNISDTFTMSMCEYAWTNIYGNAKMFRCVPQGTKKDPRFHPTQKPVALYDWIYKMYAEKGWKILDTHMGSGSSRIAAYKTGLDYVGYEIDKDYFNKAEERFKRFCEQPIQTEITP